MMKGQENSFINVVPSYSLAKREAVNLYTRSEKMKRDGWGAKALYSCL